jgi:hypothetical protein
MFTALHILPEVHRIRCIYMFMRRNQYGNLSYTSLTKWFMCFLGTLELGVALFYVGIVRSRTKATEFSLV